MSDLVRFEKRGAIGVITVDNPPVNALSPGVPEGMAECVAKGNADPDVKAMVLIGHGGKFIAGADIKQMGKGNTTPTEWRETVEMSEKPVVAAIQGYALAAASRPRCCATTGLLRRPPRLVSRKWRSASYRELAARSVCPASQGSRPRST